MFSFVALTKFTLGIVTLPCSRGLLFEKHVFPGFQGNLGWNEDQQVNFWPESYHLAFMSSA